MRRPASNEPGAPGFTRLPWASRDMARNAPRGRGRPRQPGRRRPHASSTRRKHSRRPVLVGLILVILVLSAAVAAAFTQANGAGGAWVADLLRATIGPAATARIEARYLSLSDALRQARYHAGVQRVSAPWTIPATPTPPPAHSAGVWAAPAGRSRRPAAPPTRISRQAAARTPPRPSATATEVATGQAAPTKTPPRPRPRAHHIVALSTPTAASASPSGARRTIAAGAVAPRAPMRAPARPRHIVPPAPQAMPLPAIAPLITPTLPGEGIWITAGLPAPKHGPLPPVAKTFIRPDALRPYALVTLLQFDLRAAKLHMVAGTNQPGGPRGFAGPGVIPWQNWQGERLLAAFDGGFKYSDGAYGMMVDGTVYAPPVWDAATIAVTTGGRVIMGAWGRDSRLTGANHGLVAWRQNGPLLIDHGHINPLTQEGAAWGLTVLNRAFTWRSGIGLTDHGTLLYAAGDSLSAATLARALRAAGATTAMQLDINPFWVRAFTYGRDALGRLTITPLHPAMHGNGTGYLYGDTRDFFYLTRPVAASP